MTAAQFCSTTLTYLLSESLKKNVQNIWLGCLKPTILGIDEAEATLSILSNVRNLSMKNSWGRCTIFHEPYESSFYKMIESDDVRRYFFGLEQRRLVSTRTRILQGKLYAYSRMQWFDRTSMTKLDLRSMHARDSLFLVVNISDNASLSHRLCVNLEKNGKVAFGSLAKDDHVNNGTASDCKKIEIHHAGILPLHCQLCRLEERSLNLVASQDAMVHINGVPVTAVRTLKAGDSMLIGFSTLFVIYDEKNIHDLRHSKVIWDTSMSSLHQQGLREYSLIQDYSCRHISEAPWERWRMQQLFVEISTMVLEGNYVCTANFEPRPACVHLFFD